MPIRPSRLALTACAVLAAGAAGAQDIVELPTLTVEGDANRGFFGETFAQSAGSVMKADTPILDTPRSVSIVTQQQIRRAARRTSPGAAVHAGGDGGLRRQRQPRRLALRARLRADAVPRRLQSYFGYYNNARPEVFLLDSVAVLKGRRGCSTATARSAASSTRARSCRTRSAEHRPAQLGTNDPSSRASTSAAARADGKLVSRLVGLGAARRAGRPLERRRRALHAVADLDADRGDAGDRARLPRRTTPAR